MDRIEDENLKNKVMKTSQRKFSIEQLMFMVHAVKNDTFETFTLPSNTKV